MSGVFSDTHLLIQQTGQVLKRRIIWQKPVIVAGAEVLTMKTGSFSHGRFCCLSLSGWKPNKQLEAVTLKSDVWLFFFFTVFWRVWAQLCGRRVYGDELTGKNLEGPGEEEASAFLQSEELAEEEEERQAAEDDG